jgi:heterodisulfide reductase subunit D
MSLPSLAMPSAGPTASGSRLAVRRFSSLPRSVAAVLQAAGIEFGLMGEQRCCGGPAVEMGYRDVARRLADHNTEDWRRHGVRRILVLDPHDYIAFTEDYPAYYGDQFFEEFEVVLVVELVAELIKDGRLRLERPINRVATYHDSCRLNKRKGIHEAPREILRAVPGLDFRDHDHVTQWAWCSGAGGGMAVAHPDITERISAKRMERAATLDVDLLVSACVWSERPLTYAGNGNDIEVRDLMEIVAESAGLEVGGP